MVLLEFVVDGRRYALPLEVVVRTYQAVEITPVPDTPAVVKGVVNFHGLILPVICLRRRMGLEDRGVLPTDRLVVVDTSARKVALLVDAVNGVITVEEAQFVDAEGIYSDMGFVEGITSVNGELLVVENLERLLNDREDKGLNSASERRGHEEYSAT